MKEHQIEHFTSLMSIIERYHYYMDFSRMGTGKTYVCGKISIVHDLPLFVVCPVSAKNAWESMSRECGVKLHFITSYQSLRGTEKSHPKHPYLTRRTVQKTDKKGGITKKTVFEPTPIFMTLIDQGILLVFDEGQNIKNSSDQGKASRTLSASIRGRSRCAFISGSPYDKEEHSENILRFLAILKHKRLIWSNPLTGEKKAQGLLEIINFCYSLDRDGTDEILSEYPGLQVTATKARSICHKLFSTIIKEHLSSEMLPEKSDYPIHMEESYLCLNGQPLEELENAIGSLAAATRFNGKDVDTKEIEWGAVTLAMRRIEFIMVDSLVKFANSLLVGGNKVIIAVTYLDTINALADKLSGYSPLVIDGSVNSANRTQRINQFNTDPRSRVLICTISTGGVSVSYHDTIGDSPRHMLLVPTYALLGIYQASGRIHRTGLKSDAYFYMVYGTNEATKQLKEGTIQVTPILSALIRKKDVLKSLIDKQASVYQLPGEFESKYYHL